MSRARYKAVSSLEEAVVPVHGPTRQPETSAAVPVREPQQERSLPAPSSRPPRARARRLSRSLHGNQVLQRLARSGAFDAPRGVELALAGEQGRGRPLPSRIRARMERAFGADLSLVRLHDDTTAAGLSTAISARAFAAGSDIYFGDREYAPDTQEGERVLAHELAHVVQHSSGRTLRVGSATDPLEREADAMAERALARQEEEEEVALPLRRQEEEEEEEALQALPRQEADEEEEWVEPLRRQEEDKEDLQMLRQPQAAEALGQQALASALREATLRRDGPTGASQGQISHAAGGTAPYDVSGATLQEVYDQLDPTEWGRCTVRYRATFSSTGGTITSVNITVTDSYRMPRWRGPTWSSASAAVKAEWQRMLSALWVHEHGHRDVGRTEASTIQSSLVGQPEADFNTLFAQAREAAQTEQDNYDADTSHGQTQGVSLDTSIT